MLLFTVSILMLLGALVGLLFLGKVPYARLISSAVFVLGGFALLASGTIYVNDTQTGLMVRKIGSDMPVGHIVALDGQMGPQVDILGPGYHYWYAPWNYDLIPTDTYRVDIGKVGVVLALDGASLPEGQVFAPEWANPTDMLDGRTFLTKKDAKGNLLGSRGPQSTILTPGLYRYNPRLFHIEMRDNTVINVGEVGVVKANFGKTFEDKDAVVINGTPLVPRGYRGIWKEVLQPGAYNIHPDAFTVIKVKTTQRVYTYQHNSDPKLDDAILVRSNDAFQFPVEARISVSVSGEDAPYLVAMLGNPDLVRHNAQENEELETLEAILIAPPVRAILRNTAQNLGALEFINKRSTVESNMTAELNKNFKLNFIKLEGVFIANIGLDSTEQGKALLTTQTNQQVAINQSAMYIQQQKAELDRAQLVKTTEDADQQKSVEAATFAVKVATQNALAAVETAKGNANASVEAAKGQAQAMAVTFAARAAGYKTIEDSVGRDGLIRLEVLKLVADNHIAITPTVMISGNNGNAMDALAGTMLATQAKTVTGSAPASSPAQP